MTSGTRCADQDRSEDYVPCFASVRRGVGAGGASSVARRSRGSGAGPGLLVWLAPGVAQSSPLQAARDSTAEPRFGFLTCQVLS